jgi:hypothetical protein
MFLHFLLWIRAPHQILRCMNPYRIFEKYCFAYISNFCYFKAKIVQKRLKKKKKVYYKCVLESHLHLSPVGKAPFCQKKSKSLHPNAKNFLFSSNPAVKNVT